MTHWLRTTAITGGLLLLSACGGGETTSPDPTPSRSYSVGGSVTGLSGDSLALKVNGGTALTVAEGTASWTHTTAVANGSPYTVTISKQPAGRRCTLAQASGTVSGADVTSVSVTCAAVTWVTSAVAGSDGTGYVNAQGTQAKFNSVYGIVTDPDGYVYVTDYNNHAIRKITPGGTVTTFFDQNSNSSSMGFSSPAGLARDSQGNFFVSSPDYHLIYKITPSGGFSIFAGGGSSQTQSGYTDGQGTAALFDRPQGLAVDQSDNVYVADTYNYAIRMITPQGLVSTWAGTGTSGMTNGTRAQAEFGSPQGMAFGPDGSLYVADSATNQIRMIAPDGQVSALAGTGYSGQADGVASNATFINPTQICTDSQGTVYVTENDTNTVRMVSLPYEVTDSQGNTTRYPARVSTIAGSGLAGDTDDPAGPNTTTGRIDAIAVDRDGTLYFTKNFRTPTDRSVVRKITPQ
jgi:sugar lactone lactonase YvrE